MSTATLTEQLEIIRRSAERGLRLTESEMEDGRYIDIFNHIRDETFRATKTVEELHGLLDAALIMANK